MLTLFFLNYQHDAKLQLCLISNKNEQAWHNMQRCLEIWDRIPMAAIHLVLICVMHMINIMTHVFVISFSRYRVPVTHTVHRQHPAPVDVVGSCSFFRSLVWLLPWDFGILWDSANLRLQRWDGLIWLAWGVGNASWKSGWRLMSSSHLNHE